MIKNVNKKSMKSLALFAFCLFSINVSSQPGKPDTLRKENDHSISNIRKSKIINSQVSVYNTLMQAHSLVYPDFFNPPQLSIYTGEDYTEESRQLLLELLEDNWYTAEQKEKLIKETAKKAVWEDINNKIADYEKIVSDTIKYADFKYTRKEFQDIVDSLKRFKTQNVDTVQQFQRAYKRKIESFGTRNIFPKWILIAGMLKDQRYVPVLKKALEDTVKYSRFNVEAALARLGVEPYAKKFFERYKIDIEYVKQRYDEPGVVFKIIDENADWLLYLCTQEAMREYVKLLELPHFKAYMNSDMLESSVPISVLFTLRSQIKNKDFQAYLSTIRRLGYTDEKQLKWIRNWMKENYGKYELTCDAYP